MNTYNSAMKNPILSTPSYTNYNNPQNFKFTVEQQYQNQLNQMNQAQQQQQQSQMSDPYTEGSLILNRCSQIVKDKIQNDSRYQQADREFESIIQQYLYSQILPPILQSQSGNLAAERWTATIKQLESEYSQEEVNKAKLTDTLLNDPVVIARLQELQQQTQPIQQIKPIENMENVE